MSILYQVEPHLSAEEFIDVLERSRLAERRPVSERDRIEAMLRNATVIVTARSDDRGRKLVGVSRAISDGAYCTYLSDLAVDEAFQKQGIGRALIRRTHQAAGTQSKLILLAAPAAASYYPAIGMQSHPSCWISDWSGPTEGEYVGERETHDKTHADDLDSTQEAELKNFGGLEPESLDSGNFFDSIADGYEDAIRRCVPRYNEMLWALFEYLPPTLLRPKQSKPSRILELGCGTGNLTVRVREKFPDAELTLVDLSEASLTACQKRLGNSEHVRFVKADMRALEFPEGTFDLIVSTIALHHLESDEKRELFANCYRWLDDAGVLTYSDQFAGVADDVYQRHMALWHQYAQSAGASTAEWEMWMEHQRLHDFHDPLPDQLRWLAEAGFENVDSTWRYLLWTVMQGRKPSPPVQT